MLVPMVTLVNVMMEALTQRTGFSASGPQFRSEDVFKIIIHSHSQWYRTCFKKCPCHCPLSTRKLHVFVVIKLVFGYKAAKLMQKMFKSQTPVHSPKRACSPLFINPTAHHVSGTNIHLPACECLLNEPEDK